MSVSRIIIGLAVLAALVLGGLWWRATWVANHLLHSEAPKAIAEKSGGVYRLAVARVRFNPLRRRIHVDSIDMSTDTAVNSRRPRPRSALRLSFHQCTIAGMQLFALVAGRGLIAESFGCSAVQADVEVPARQGIPDTASAPAAGGQAFFILQQGLQLPKFAPRVEVTRIDFPHAELDFRLRRARQPTVRLQLEHLQWHMADFTVDPADSVATSRPLFSRTVHISAENFVGSQDSAAAVRVTGFAASLHDSTVEIRDIAYAPTLSDSAFARANAYRRSLLKTSVGRIAVRGFDAGALVLGDGIRARRVQVDSLHVDVLSDRRRPPNPVPRRRRTPQKWIADLERSVRIDSVLVQGGEVRYREQRPRHAKPGVMTFARLEAVAVNVRHVAGRRRRGDAMALRATAYLQHAGRLDAQFVVPLDAPGFDMTFKGALGPMPAAGLNAFVQETFALRVEKGRIIGIRFDARVANGVARGGITPCYTDLSIRVTGRGSTGILGTGGVVGDVARGVATFVANLTELHADNPGDGEKAPRGGTINHTFNSHETLPAFLWASLRDGLFAVVRK
jgi:hypothetical protein